MSHISTSRSITIGQEHLKLNSAARRSYNLLLVARNRERMDDLAKKLAADTRPKVEILAADLTNSNDFTGLDGSGLFLHLRKAIFNAFERSVEAIPEDHRRI